MKKSHIHIVGISLLSVLPFLAACGDDASSSSAGVLTHRESSKISVDEANRTITIFSSETQDLCYYDESSESYKWREDGYVDADTFSYTYFFRGDSLILLDAEEDYSFGTVLVGEKANSLYGTWNLSNSCDYSSFADEILCDDSDEFGSATRITFGKNTLTLVATAEVFDDYMNSDWMYSFYRGLSDGNFYIEPVTILSGDSVGVMGYIQMAGIQIRSQTKNRVDFTWNDTVDVSVKIRLEDEVRNEELVYTAEVQADGATCSLFVDWMYEVGKSQCTMENAEYFVTRDEEISEDSSVIRVRRAEKHNMDEFTACLENLFGKKARNDTVIFYKQAAREKASARKERAEKLLDRIRMVQ